MRLSNDLLPPLLAKTLIRIGASSCRRRSTGRLAERSAWAVPAGSVRVSGCAQPGPLGGAGRTTSVGVGAQGSAGPKLRAAWATRRASTWLTGRAGCRRWPACSGKSAGGELPLPTCSSAHLNRESVGASSSRRCGGVSTCPSAMNSARDNSDRRGSMAASIAVPAATAPARAPPNRRRPTAPRPPPRPGCGALASWPGVRAVFEDQIACNIVARSEGIRTP